MPLFSSIFSKGDQSQSTTPTQKRGLFCRKPRATDAFVGLTPAEALQQHYYYQCELKEAGRLARERQLLKEGASPSSPRSTARRSGFYRPADSPSVAPRAQLRPLTIVRAQQKRTSVLATRPPSFSTPRPTSQSLGDSEPWAPRPMSVASPRDSSLRPLRLGRIPSSESTSSSLTTCDSFTSSNTVSICSTAPSSIDAVEISLKESQAEYPAPIPSPSLPSLDALLILSKVSPPVPSRSDSPIPREASPSPTPAPKVSWPVGRDLNSTVFVNFYNPTAANSSASASARATAPPPRKSSSSSTCRVDISWPITRTLDIAAHLPIICEISSASVSPGPEYPLPLPPYADAIFTEIQHLNELMLDPVLQLIPGWVEETEARIEELLFELRRGTALEEDLIAGTKEREEKQAGRTAQKDARWEGEVVGLKWV
ncbi:hypothetical protein JCM11641_005150 [Rhodosporidiobolus odoratus]